MKLSLITRGLAASSALSLAALIASFASCATQDEAADTSPDPIEASTVPEASPTVDPDAGADAGGCDAAAESCTTEVVRCETVAWCTVTTNVSVLYALGAVWGSGPNDVWAAGSGGTIIHYDGTTWTATPSGIHDTFHAVWGSGPNDVWVVSSTQVVLHGTGFANGTAVWTNVPTALEDSNSVFLRAIWGSSASDVRVGGRAYDLTVPELDFYGTGDQFVKRTLPDGGTAWLSRPGTQTVTGIWGSSADDVWMTADNSVYVPYQRGMILHGTPGDAGADASVIEDRLTWTAVDSQSSLTLESVWGSAKNDVWAVGGLGTIRHLTPADARWQKVVSPTTQTLRSVWGSGPNDIWAVGDEGTIVHYDGATFKTSTAQLPLGRKPKLRGVWGSSANDVWIVGDGVALHYTGPKSGAGGAQ